MAEPTHAGGIVVRPGQDELLYLIVEADSKQEEWVFPKGHIEVRDGRPELPEEAAQREVREEAGVLADVITRIDQLKFQRADKTVCVEMFLMRYTGKLEATEDREVRWLPFETARQTLSHEDARELLRRARSLTETTT